MLPALVLGAALLLFSGVGIALWVWAIRDVVGKRQHLKHAERYEGTIQGVQERVREVREQGRVRTRYIKMHFPVIEFTRASGEKVSFVSEIGDASDESKYEVGQTIRVIYDPDRVLPPMLDSWSGIWYLPLTLAIAGTVILGAVVLMAVLFIPKVLSQL